MAASKKLPQCNPGYRYTDQPPPGKESDRGWCHACSAGTYTDERNRATQCKSCTVCSAELGLVEVQPCRPSADALCRCADGPSALEHGRCRPNATAASESNPTLAVETGEALIAQGSLGSNVKVAITKLGRNNPFEALSQRSRSLTTKFPLQSHSTALHAAAIEFSVHNLTAGEAQNIIFFLGNTAVTLPMMSLGNAGFVCLVIMAVIGGILFARRRRKAIRRQEAIEISQESDAHVHVNPESLMAAHASAPRIDATFSNPTTTTSKTHGKLERLNLTPLLRSNTLTFHGHPTYYDFNCSSAFSYAETHCSIQSRNARRGISNTGGRLGLFTCDGTSTEVQSGLRDI